MKNMQYSDGVLTEKFNMVEERFDQQLEYLGRIEGQTVKTNGRVSMHDKLLWTAIGALPLLTIWAGWLTNQVLKTPEADPAQIQAAVAAGIADALAAYKEQNKI